MKWMLDTNACILYIAGRAPKLRAQLDSHHSSDIVVCSVVKAELFFGSAKSHGPLAARAVQDAFLSRFESYPFDDRCANIYGTLRKHLASRGTPIGPNDLMIAATALSNQLTLVSHNVSEFSRVPGLMLDDWE